MLPKSKVKCGKMDTRETRQPAYEHPKVQDLDDNGNILSADPEISAINEAFDEVLTAPLSHPSTLHSPACCSPSPSTPHPPTHTNPD